ncbi:MAG: hypothetical protein AAGD96_33965 [Chloroflexota bacterium]
MEKINESKAFLMMAPLAARGAWIVRDDAHGAKKDSEPKQLKINQLACEPFKGKELHAESREKLEK